MQVCVNVDKSTQTCITRSSYMEGTSPEGPASISGPKSPAARLPISLLHTALIPHKDPTHTRISQADLH